MVLTTIGLVFTVIFLTYRLRRLELKVDRMSGASSKADKPEF